jgi:hypothetical protein
MGPTTTQYEFTNQIEKYNLMQKCDNNVRKQFLNHILEKVLKKLPKKCMEGHCETLLHSSAVQKLVNTAYGNLCNLNGYPRNDLEMNAYRLVSHQIASFILSVI